MTNSIAWCNTSQGELKNGSSMFDKNLCLKIGKSTVIAQLVIVKLVLIFTSIEGYQL
jgi:hypothetical protein